MKHLRRKGSFAKERRDWDANTRIRERLDKRAQREESVACDWVDPQDKLAHSQLSRREQRMKDIREVCGEHMVCPKCGQTTAPRSWVLKVEIRFKKGVEVRFVEGCCRACHLDEECERKPEVINSDKPLTPLEARIASGLSQSRFAKACGWSQPFQSKLERSEGASESQVEKIVAVLTQRGCLPPVSPG